MKNELIRYLQSLRDNLRLEPSSEKEIIREFETYVEDECREMQKSGIPEDEALEKCLKLLGSAKAVARQIYDVHSQANWRQAILAAIPHLFFALLFTLNWLAGVAWLPIIVAVAVGVAVYGWCRGKPAWLFPWLGYSLFPVVAAGVSLLWLPRVWSWVTLVLYIPLALWLSCFITIKFIRRDWLFSTMMLLPALTIIGWFFASEREVVFPDAGLQFLYDYAPWTGLTFLLLAVAVTLFLRLRRRWLRVLALCTAGLATSTVVTLASPRLGIAGFFWLAVLMISFLLVPVLVERKIKKDTVTPPVGDSWVEVKP